MNGSIEMFLSLFVLLLISTGVFFVSKKIKLPYTVLLVLAGLIIVPLSKIDIFSFISDFKLTPNLLFFIFLPTLLFESAYNMSLRQLGKNIKSISALAIFSLLISTFFIGYVLNFFSGLIGFEIPLEVALLFGALISATDPVAVLALFKEYGAPKRLAFIFEGESIFNDGTSLAIFLVILETIRFGFHGFSSITQGVFTFFTMIIGGVLMGLMMGGIFSKLLQYAKNNEQIQVTLTMVMAHLTFILTDFISERLVFFGQEIRFSPIIATTFAALVIGNYGRYKISPKVEEYMEKFWSYFVFVVNSIVFLLMGLLFANLPFELKIFTPAIILIVILIVMIGRAVSIYPIVGIINFLKIEERIAGSWQHLLVWGSLRGALAITMVFLIPQDLTLTGWEYTFSIRDFLMALTISCIYFTIFIKATTINPFMNKLGLNNLSDVEKVEYRDSKKIIYGAALAELSDFHEKGYIAREDYERMKKTYVSKCCDDTDMELKLYENSNNLFYKVLNTYAIGIAQCSLKELYRYGEVSNKVYKQIRIGLDILLEKSENGEKMDFSTEDIAQDDLIDYLISILKLDFFSKIDEEEIKNKYIYYRTVAIISNKVLRVFSSQEFTESLGSYYDKNKLDDILNVFKESNISANKKMIAIFKEKKSFLSPLSESLAEKSILGSEDRALIDLRDKKMITEKVYTILSEEVMR